MKALVIWNGLKNYHATIFSYVTSLANFQKNPLKYFVILYIIFEKKPNEKKNHKMNLFLTKVSIIASQVSSI